jgi:hypothetical protein
LSNCPVTNIQILSAQDSSTYKQDDYNQIIDFNDDYKILVSKEVKSLPLAQFRVEESEPCMDYFGQSSSLPNNQNDHYQRFDYKYHIEGIHYDDGGSWALKDK